MRHHRVIVIVDPKFGERLAHLPDGVPIWIVKSADNIPVAHRLWKDRPDASYLTGITTFGDAVDSPEENLISNLATIDLHHGVWSAQSPFSEIEVFGTQLTDRIKIALLEYEFDRLEQSGERFVAIRSSGVPAENPRMSN